MTEVFLSLGSNVGDRQAHLRRGLRALGRLPRTRLLKASRLYETSPYGVTGQRAYINAAASLLTGLSPMGLLVHLKSIEAEEGRRTLRRWAPRPLDIDILFYGRLKLKNPFLTVPHPGALQRRFVLAPLAEIAPRFRPFLRRLKDTTQEAKRIGLSPLR